MSRKRLAVLAALVVTTALMLTASTVFAAGKGGGKAPQAKVRTAQIIDYVDGHKPRHNPGGPNGDNDTEPTADHEGGHYELIGATWTDPSMPTPLDFTIDDRLFPTGGPQDIEDALATWESLTGGDLVGTISHGVVAEIRLDDGVNSITMRNLGDGKILGVAIYRYFDANGNEKLDGGDTFLEVDVILNFLIRWGNPGDNGKWYHLLTVAIHEAGHVFGLDHSGTDHDEDRDQVMYRSTSSKTVKVPQGNGDIPGIQDPFLGYGAPDL